MIDLFFSTFFFFFFFLISHILISELQYKALLRQQSLKIMDTSLMVDGIIEKLLESRGSRVGSVMKNVNLTEAEVRMLILRTRGLCRFQFFFFFFFNHSFNRF